MRQKIIIGAIVVLCTGALLRVITNPARAQSVEQAAQRLEKTEQRIADEVTKSAGNARVLQHELGTPQAPERLPGEVQEFVRSTDRLRQLAADLEKDIGSYDAARAAKLATLDQELQLINETSTRRHMERLRARAQRRTTEQLQAAKTALDALQAVLAQGADLQHAARCVQLADELQLQGADLHAQVQKTKEHVSAYAQLSTALLAKLTLTEQKAD